MSLSYTFQRLAGPERRIAFTLSLAGVLLLQVVFISLNTSLTTAAAPLGILSFEFAGELPVARSIIASWGNTGQLLASFSIGLDYLFIVTYVMAIGLACTSVARWRSEEAKWLVPLGLSLAWAQIGAGLLDAVENYALMQVLLGSEQDIFPLVARWCAIPKFIIVGAGGFYVILGSVTKVMARILRPDWE